MKPKAITVIAFFLLAITFLVSCNKKAKESTNDETSYYTCPMHPQIHEHKPGKCPICGMDLVKKEVQ